MYAVIKDGIVTDRLRVDPYSIYPEYYAVEFIQVSDEVQLGWSYINGEASPPPIHTPTVEEYKSAIQGMLDAEARTHGYDGILSLASYASSTNPPFSLEGKAGLDWRDAVWGKGYALMAQVQAGTLAQPTIPELLAMLPKMVWP